MRFLQWRLLNYNLKSAFFDECQFCPKLIQIPPQNVILLNSSVEVHKTGYFQNIWIWHMPRISTDAGYPQIVRSFPQRLPPSSTEIRNYLHHYWLDSSVWALAFLKTTHCFPLFSAILIQFLAPKILTPCHTQSSHEINNSVAVPSFSRISYAVMLN